MIKVTEMTNTDSNPDSYKVAIFADTKDEVRGGGEIVGFPEGAAMEMGSTCTTADGHFAFMQSNGSWNWRA